MADPWNPDQYERFKSERSQPYFDLLAMVQPGPASALDLGCGTGELTAELHRRLALTRTTGVDNSPAMLNRAAVHAGSGLDFSEGDLSHWSPAERVDLVFSNAALQWVPNHVELFSRITGWLRPGGQLALQMPANFDHPSHSAAVDVAEMAQFRADLGGFRREVPVLPIEDYASLLYRLGYREQRVTMNVYSHLLPDRDAVVEWVKGTLLTTYQERLSPERYDEFLTAYRCRLADLLPDTKPYLYPFKRILLWARRPN